MRRAPALAAEALVLLSVCLAPWPLGSAPDAARYALTGVLLLAAALWMLGRGLDGGGRPLPLAVLGLPALGLLQLVLGRSAAPSRTADAVLLTTAFLLVLAYAAERTSEPRAATRFAVVALLAGLSQAAFAVQSWSAAPTRIYGVARPDVTMPFGSFVNHNHFAGFTELILLLAVGFCLGHARRSRQLTPAAAAVATAALALAAAHLASRSRGGLLALAGGTLVLGTLAVTSLFRSDAKAARSRTLLIAGSCGVALLAFAWLAVSAPARRHLLTTLSRQRDGSASYRLDTWTTTLRLAGAHPLLGSGLGAYEDAVPRYKTGHGQVRTTHAENDAVEFLAEAGLLGAAAASWLGLWLLRRFRLRLGPGRSPLRKGIAAGAFSGAAALLLHSFFDFNLRIPSNALAFVVLLGLAAAEPREAADAVVPRRPALLSAAFVALLGVAAFWRAAGARGFETSLRLSDWNARVTALGSVTRRHPYLAEAWRERARAWRELADPQSPLRYARLERAAADLAIALRLRPNWAEAWADRGWIRGMQGDLAGAGRDLERAHEIDPTHPGIQLMWIAFRGRAGMLIK